MNPAYDAYDDSADPRADLREALGRAGADGKRVALLFGADWCPDCHALDAALAHPLVAPLVEAAFMPVRVSVGNRNLNLDLMAEHGLTVERGIPAVAFLEPSGEQVGALADGELRNARCLAPVEIATLFNRFLPAGRLG